MTRWLVALLVLFTVTAKVYAQGPECDMKEAHGPIYPPIAKAAHVQGDVLFRGSFDHNGKLSDLQFVSGPTLLRQSSENAIKTWEAKPFSGPRSCFLVVHYRIEGDTNQRLTLGQQAPGHLTVTATHLVLYSQGDPSPTIIHRKRFGSF